MEARSEHFRASLSKGRLTVTSVADKKVFSFPRRDHPQAITCMEIALDFLIFGTKTGNIFYYFLDEQSGPECVGWFHHSGGAVKRLWPNSLGTRLVFEDDSGVAHVYNAVSQQAVIISEFKGLDSALWDADDTHVFAVSRGCEDWVYVYTPASIYGPQLRFVGSSSRPAGLFPVALQNGVLSCQMDHDRLEACVLDTHKWLKMECSEAMEQKLRFEQNLSLLHFKEAWNDAMLLNTKETWDMLVKKALLQMEIELATKACQQSRNFGLLMSLKELENIEDSYLLAGHIMALFGEYDAAQECFLRSTDSESAVDLRMSLQQWDQALALAVDIGSSSINEIKWGYAQMLERRGEYRHALAHYQETLNTCLSGSPRCFEAKAGVARTLIHVGDIWKGKQRASECNDTGLYAECARILERLKLFQDAAELYELASQHERATGLYIRVKNYAKARPLLQQLENCKLHIEYAKAMEGEGRLTEASAAYEAAEDIENVVRLELGPLNNPTRAFSILQKMKSVAGALAATKFCKSSGDYDRAIEFLVMARRKEEARELAQLHGRMDAYTKLVIDVASKEECLGLAKYYETLANYTQAGLLFERCNEAKHALNVFLQWGSSEGIEQAIAMVGRLRSEALISQLFDYLLEESRTSKTQRHVFRLYTVLEQFDKATATAAVISSKEQEEGNYKNAHQLLLEHCQALRTHGLELPSELFAQLMLLHSYILVKTLIRLDDHKSAARMLIRIVRHISKFPAHVVQILTSAVIECQRSSLKKSAFEYASMLMNPEYRQLISPVYKRKIEKIVRKPEKVEDEEALSACPFCSLPIPETQLDCPACGSSIPFCIATGRHMELGNWTTCPACKFPALTSELRKILEVEKTCPMCNETVTAEELEILDDPLLDKH